MRQQNELLGSRTRVTERYALLPLEGIPLSRLPEWPTAGVQVLASPSLGAQFAEYRIELGDGGVGNHTADGKAEHFIFLLSGEAELSLSPEGNPEAQSAPTHRLSRGGYALIPPIYGYRFQATADSSILLLRKRYESAAGIAPFDPLVGNERDTEGEIYMGDPGALLQTLIPDDFSFDMAMNIFTFQSGHSLPVTETHVMEHGLYVLQGKGVYYLDDRWMEIDETDFIWMGPFCPQSYYATGPAPTRYIYYKNVNREIPL